MTSAKLGMALGCLGSHKGSLGRLWDCTICSGVEFGSKSACVDCVSRPQNCRPAMGFVGWVALHARKEGLSEWRESGKRVGHGRLSK